MKFCPNCGNQYKAGEVCARCGEALSDVPSPVWGRSLPGDLTEKWPKDASGEPVAPVYLTHCTGLDMDDAMLVSMLEAYGIPSLRQYPNDGDFGRLILGLGGGGVDIFVPEIMAEDANDLITEVPDDDELQG